MKSGIIVFSILALNAILTGCVDYGLNYFYSIDNKLNQPIIVRFIPPHDTQKTDTIRPASTKEIFRETYLCKKHFIPQKADIVFEKIEVFYSDTIKIRKDFTNNQLWDFTNCEYEGKYILKIDTALLSSK